MAKSNDDWDTTPGRTGRRTISQIMGDGKKNSSGDGDGDSSSSSSSSKKSSKKKSSSKSKKVNKSKTYKEATLPVPAYRVGMPNELSVSRAGLEIYETDEVNFEPFVPTGSVTGEGVTTVEDESIDSDNEEEELPAYSLHFGNIVRTNYETALESISFEGDYKGMTNSATVKLDKIKPKISYKGVRVKLLTEWDDYEDMEFKWEYLNDVTLGFITEQTFSDNSVEMQIAGMTKTLDMKYKFDFKQMYRSEIINQVIKTAGLKPVLNFKGLEDDIIDFKNYSESEGSNEDTTVEVKSTGSKSLDEAIKKAVSGVTGDLNKAKALDKAFVSHCVYQLYSDCEHSSLESAWKDGSLNCADGANVLCAMFLAVGLNAVIVHLPASVTEGYGHYIVKITISGKDYYVDSSGSSGSHRKRGFNNIWPSNSVIKYGSTVGTKIS